MPAPFVMTTHCLARVMQRRIGTADTEAAIKFVGNLIMSALSLAKKNAMQPGDSLTVVTDQGELRMTMADDGWLVARTWVEKKP